MTSAAERVAAGAAFLDEHDPDWWRAGVERAIDLDRLRMNDGRACILGQRCPLEMGDGCGPSRYFIYASSLSGIPMPPGDPWAHEDELDLWAGDYGFTLIQLGDWADLTAEWARVIRERREAGAS